jgi:hypothetical protein
MRILSDQDRQALQLADDLQKAMAQWLSSRGVDQSCTISPFVNPAGQPAVIITMNAHVAWAMIDSLQQQHAGSARLPGADDPTGNLPFTP